jgi:hypothetical protein
VREIEQPTARSATVELVYLSNGRTVPRDLYRFTRRVPNLFWASSLLPFALLLACAFMPGSALLPIAASLNDLVWTHIKPVSLAECNEKCWLAAYSMIAVSVSCGSAVVLAPIAVCFTVQDRQAQVDALRRGAAPWGRLPDGTAKPLPKAGTALLAGLGGMGLLTILLVGLMYFLVEFSGSDQTVSIRNGREYSMGYVSLHIAVIIGIAQFCATAWVMFATHVFLGLKSLLKNPNSGTFNVW